MNPLRRGAAIAAIVLAVPLVACDKPAPPPAPKPPPPKAQAPALSPHEELKRIAGEVYVFAYPLVMMDLTRQIATAKVPPNAFSHRRTLADATTKDAPRPNADVIFSTAWLDLSKEPLVLSLPDTRGRYYVVPMLDAWTNVFTSPGKRQTGTEKIDFLVAGPKWKGTVPEGVSEIRAPTAMVWLIGRMESTRADLPAATKLLDQFKLTPLSQWGKRPPRGGASAPAAAATALDVKTPPDEQIERMDARTFFSRVAALLPDNPPASADAPMLPKLERLGVVAGQPFDTSKRDPAEAAAIDEGVKAARTALATAARGSLGDLRNGWTIHWDLGRYGTNYGYRALMASQNLGANAPEDAIFAATRFDANGKPLDGSNRYVLHFDKGKEPPTEAFWALSMYDEQHLFVPNPIDRHAIGDRDRLQRNPDGSLDIYVQNQNPGRDKESNWLPAPKGPFNVMLRIYWPKQEVLERRWTPPGIQLAR